MNDADLRQIETALLNIYLPGITKAQRKALRKLCKEKGMKIYSPELRSALTNLLASIIRHRETNYESMCAAVGRNKARFYVQPIIQEGLSRISG